MEQLKKDLLNIFKKYRTSDSKVIPPEVLREFIDSNNKDTAHNTIDDLIIRGLIIETKENHKPTFKLTKYGYEHVDEEK
jgi:predicted transcriptional regulator